MSRSVSLKSVLLQWQNELPLFDYNCRKRIFGFVQGSLHKFYDNDDFIPTKKGIAFDLSKTGEIVQGLLSLEDEGGKA